MTIEERYLNAQPDASFSRKLTLQTEGVNASPARRLCATFVEEGVDGLIRIYNEYGNPSSGSLKLEDPDFWKKLPQTEKESFYMNISAIILGLQLPLQEAVFGREVFDYKTLVRNLHAEIKKSKLTVGEIDPFPDLDVIDLGEDYRIQLEKFNQGRRDDPAAERLRYQMGQGIQTCIKQDRSLATLAGRADLVPPQVKLFRQQYGYDKYSTNVVGAYQRFARALYPQK